MQTDARDGVAHPPKLAKPRQPPGLKNRLKALAAWAVPRSFLVKRGVTGAHRVALTFDDGPHEMTDAYLDVLDRYGARATFFVVGKECAPRPDVLARIAVRGHELAGHGYTHDPFPTMTAAGLRDELARTSALLPAPSTRRRLVRPPRGATSLRSLAVCAHAGYTTVLWSRDSDDCRTLSKDDVVARLAPDGLAPGEIVLLHEGQTWTLEALPRALEAFARAGWRAVTVGEIIGASRP